MVMALMTNEHIWMTDEQNFENDPNKTTSETQFEDLNFELKEKIFSLLNNGTERQLIRRVCSSWCTIINESFGIKLLLNNSNFNLLSTCPSAIEIEFNSLTLPIEIDKILSRHRIESLIFRNIIVSYNLIPLIFCTRKLSKVQFYESVIDLPEDLIEIPINSKLATIKKLYFRNWHFGTSLASLISVLSKMKFEQLDDIEINTGIAFTPSIPFQHVFNPPNSLTPETVSSFNPVVQLIIKNLKSLKLFIYGSANFPTRLKFCMSQTEEIPQLEEFAMPHGHVEISSILSSQRNLKVLQLGMCQFENWTTTRTCITTNSSTLKKIHLRSITFGHEWNCNVFENAKGLEDLSVLINTSPKINLALLPKSLKKLELDGTIAKTELIQLFHLQNLEHLRICGLGGNLINVLPDIEIDLEERIDLPLFKSFLIKLPKLKLLAFKDCTARSLDYDSICDWCDEIGLFAERSFYDLLGRQIMHGFTLEIPESLVRTNISAKTSHEIEDILHPKSIIEEAKDALHSCWDSLGFSEDK